MNNNSMGFEAMRDYRLRQPDNNELTSLELAKRAYNENIKEAGDLFIHGSDEPVELARLYFDCFSREEEISNPNNWPKGLAEFIKYVGVIPKIIPYNSNVFSFQETKDLIDPQATTEIIELYGSVMKNNQAIEVNIGRLMFISPGVILIDARHEHPLYSSPNNECECKGNEFYGFLRRTSEISFDLLALSRVQMIDNPIAGLSFTGLEIVHENGKLMVKFIGFAKGEKNDYTLKDGEHLLDWLNERI